MVLPILAIGAGTVALAGVALGGLAIATPEDEEKDFIETFELALIRTGYVSEGVIKGVLTAAPPALVIILLVSLSLSLMKYVERKGDIYA